MTPEEFMVAARLTDIPDYDIVRNRFNAPGIAEIFHAVAGICTEAGEMMDALKKYLIYGKPLDMVNLIEESGDMEWYNSLLIESIGTDYEKIFKTNIEKLRKRYPNKFTEHDALNRDLEGERGILEGRDGKS